MTVWIAVAAIAVIAGYILGRLFGPSGGTTPIVITLNNSLDVISVVPDPKKVKPKADVTWKVVFRPGPAPADVDVWVTFKDNVSPFDRGTLKSGPGNPIFGAPADQGADGKDYRYGVWINGVEKVDPVIQIRER